MRAEPLHCPYCGEEDLRPHGETHGAWECRACLRVFQVKFVGLLSTIAVPRNGETTAAPRDGKEQTS